MKQEIQMLQLETLTLTFGVQNSTSSSLIKYGINTNIKTPSTTPTPLIGYLPGLWVQT